MRLALTFLVFFFFFSLSPDFASAAGSVATPENNVLVIVGDDVGVDLLTLYDQGGLWDIPDLPPLPNLDALAARGVTFTNAWASPACSPTRATTQTGRYAFRTGVLGIVPLPPHPPTMGIDLQYEKLLPRTLCDIFGANTVGTAAIGKWHISTAPTYDELVHAPNDAGYSHYSGSLFNVSTGQSYFDWDRTENGSMFRDTRYATTANVDDALAWIGQTEFEEKPWFMWLAFNAPHSPYHKPPASLHSRNLLGVDCTLRPRPCFLAMLEAMDREIGRLVAALDAMPGDVLERTTIIFFGDNGTPKEVTVSPFDPDHAKQTLYEGGIHVPLIAAGYGVANGGRRSDALVSVTDIYGTTLELMVGAQYPRYLRRSLGDGRATDSVSFLPILKGTAVDTRTSVFAESRLIGASGKMMRQLERDADGKVLHSYKLILFSNIDGTPDPGHGVAEFEVTDQAFYDLVSDPFEQTNLCEGGLYGETAVVYEDLCGRISALTGLEIGCDLPNPWRGEEVDGRDGRTTELTSNAVRVSLATDTQISAASEELRLVAMPSSEPGRIRFRLLGHTPHSVAGVGQRARLSLYDVSGRVVARIWTGQVDAIPQELDWSGTTSGGRRLASGAYIARLDVGGKSVAVAPVRVRR